MELLRFSHPSTDQKSSLAAYAVSPREPAVAMLQISHGMCEHFLRYTPLAEFLADHGILVFGHDHLGHGGSVSSRDELGFTVSGGGADALVEDLLSLGKRMKEEHPSLPLILFGHSMGSFIAREALTREDKLYRAAVICGTGGPETPAAAGRLLASLLIGLRGERHRSELLRRISFAGYNREFGRDCDPNAWLSRDEEVVARYNADPLCGYLFTLRGYHDLFSLVERVSKKNWAQKLPKDLPLWVVSGKEDPVGGRGKGVESVCERIRKAGVQDVTLTLYPKMRHEILNELQKEQVWTDLLKWIEKYCRS